MNTSSAQYPSAIDVETGRTVEALDLQKKDVLGRKYACPHCHGRLSPVLLGKRVKHFRHEEGHKCSYDHYLHDYAEAVFLEEYKRCLDNGLPFLLERSVPVRCNHSCVLKEHLDCKERYNRKTYNLAEEFTKISLEHPVRLDDGHLRRPDILLERENGSPLWIEICVSHETDPLDNPDRIRVIEIKINSKEDIDRIIRGHRIVQSDDDKNWVRLHYFSSVLIDEPLQKVPPCEKLFVYDLEQGHYCGRARITEEEPGNPSQDVSRLVLQLNWNGSHSGDGNAPTHYTREELAGFCRSRLLTGKTGDLLVSQLIKEEHRSTHPALSKGASSNKPRNGTHASTAFDPTDKDDLPEAPPTARWINLGLPSETLWCDINGAVANPNFLGYETTPRIPSRADIYELKQYCTQFASADGGLVHIVGKNGQSIQLLEGRYRLSDRPKDGGVYYVNLFALSEGDYLHIIEDDYFGKNCNSRFILHKKEEEV